MDFKNFEDIKSKIDEVLKKKDEKGWDELSKAIIKFILENLVHIISGDTERLVKTAEVLGKVLKENGLTTSQIRNIFSEIKAMEMKGFGEKEIQRRLLLLKPKIVYASARSGAKRGTKELSTILIQAIDMVLEKGITEEKFDNFCKFFEAILAYHRASGGK